MPHGCWWTVPSTALPTRHWRSRNGDGWRVLSGCWRHLRSRAACQRRCRLLREVLSLAGGWTEIIAAGSIPSQRDLLGLLIAKVVPERIGYGQYEARIAWSPLGAALVDVTDQMAPIHSERELALARSSRLSRERARVGLATSPASARHVRARARPPTTHAWVRLWITLRC